MARPRCKINELVGESCRRQRRERSPYCTDKCKKRYHYIKNKKKKKPEPSGKSSTNRGQHYKDFVTLYAQKIEDKVFTHQQVADLMDIGRVTVTEMYAAYREDKAILEAQQDWEIAEETKKS